VLYDTLELFRYTGAGVEIRKKDSNIEVLEYLYKEKQNIVFNINPEIDLIIPEGDREGITIERVNIKELYWSFEQILVYQSTDRYNIQTGDLLGNRTISR
jgi:2-keto-4-pentenoate hydratase/2-oxohepta-3-ene-1,7-dioic acid hydratase in catechol pathway